MIVPLKPEQIAAAIRCPLANVAENWPRIELCLEAFDSLRHVNVGIAILGTVAVETAWKFLPIREYGSEAYFRKMYWDNVRVRGWLGNRTPEDAIRYHGRGFSQLTGYANYKAFGARVGVNLVDDPDLALEPDVAASVTAAFALDKHIAQPAVEANWPRVRKIWNGGTNGLPEFLDVVAKLEIALGVHA